jgi:polyhydroxyalkanoate synthesis regulator phasin
MVNTHLRLSGKICGMTEAVPPPESYGRVDSDGTVYVTTADGERSVGQIPDVPAEEALAFFTRRFTALETEVGLLEERIKRGALNPEEARRAINAVKSSITDANAVGDLAGLATRLDALAPVLAVANEARKAERAKAQDETKVAKEAMVAEAEKIAAGNDWRGGVNRFRTLLDEWKALPRIDRATDDDLWHRFSTARTTYTRRRKTQFAEQSAQRDGAKQAKEAIIAEAREIAASTEWGAAAGAFRDLMTRWKAAGPAARDVDDKLWAEFRGIQDEFFARRTEAATATDAEFGANLEAKLVILDAAEKDILPVTDLTVARDKYRRFLAKYNEHGRVPRDNIRPLEGRVRAIEKAITEAEENEWRRTDPETQKRASGTVTLLSDQIAKLTAQLDRATAAKDAKKISELTASIATYESWLVQATKTLEDFKG